MRTALRTLSSRYAVLWSQRDVPRLLLTALLGRLPVGTVTLGMLMHAQAITGSFAHAGAVVGAYLFAMAAAAPLVGRLIDRKGPRLPLIVTGCVCPAALTVLLAAEPLGLSQAALPAVAAIAGAFVPPISVLIRMVWRYRFDAEAERRTAFAIDAVIVELAFVLGPALIGGLLAIASPAAAFAAACAFALVAVPIFMASPALGYIRHEPFAARRLLGPLAEGRLLVVYATTLALTFSFGLAEVGYPATATAADRPAFGAILIALMSLGSAIGGFTYGAVHWRRPMERQFALLLGMLALALGVQAPIASLALLAPFAVVAGLVVAPCLIVASLLVSQHAPAHYAAEAFTWLSTFIVTGIGGGMAIGGQLAETTGVWAVFATAAAALVCGALIASALGRRR